MPRRSELRSLASGMTTFCVCRNNDIGGYWGLGVLCRNAQNRGDFEISFQILPGVAIADPELSVRRNVHQRFFSQPSRLTDLTREIFLNFSFEPFSKSDFRGTRFKGTCTVSITDDLGVSRTASASHFCYPHNPEFESRSTRAEQD